MATPGKITPKKQKEFLELLSETGLVNLSASVCDISRQCFYRKALKDKKFKAAWKKAQKEGEARKPDAIESELYRRGIMGVDEPVYYKGQVVGYIRKYSDTCLIAMANAEKPEKYRYNQKVELDGDLTVKVMKFSDGGNATK